MSSCAPLSAINVIIIAIHKILSKGEYRQAIIIMTILIL